MRRLKPGYLMYLLFAVGCATITGGTSQHVTIDTVNAKGARCAGVQHYDGKDEDPILHTWVDTPASLVIKRSSAAIKLTCKKKGYKDLEIKIESKFRAATVGNILLGGGIGIVVDAMTGANYHYPDVLKFPMEPVDSAPEPEKKRYKKALRDVEIWKKQKEEKLQREIEAIGQ